MSGDWIKMRGNLWDDPRVAAIVDATGTNEASVIGALYWLWAAADQHTTDGLMAGLLFRQINRKSGIKGFAEATAAVGWIEEVAGGVQIARFEEHNGASAKRRCTEAKRKANGRKTSASNADKKRTESGRGAELEIEKEKEEAKEGAPAAAPPDFRTDIFRRWKAMPDGGGGAYLAKVIAEFGEDAALNAADKTLEAERADPKGYIRSILRVADQAATAHDALMARVQ